MTKTFLYVKIISMKSFGVFRFKSVAIILLSLLVSLCAFGFLHVQNSYAEENVELVYSVEEVVGSSPFVV